MKKKGIVHFVGAGPGDAQLLTVRAAELLGRAEVVMHDAHVSPDVLRLIPAKARIIALPVNDAADAAGQPAQLARLAADGQCVVRLYHGDPFVFGDGAAEATLLMAAGFGIEVVPGVLPFTGVPNCAGIPLTHRAHCSSFTVTKVRAGTTPDGGTDLNSLTRTPGTKVVLTDAAQVAPTVARLLAEGLAADTPAALVVSGTLARQRSVTGALADLPTRVAAAGLAGPAVMIIGSVVGLAAKLNWFETRPLFGQRVVVTRARDQAGALSRPLQERGAEVLEVPCIRLGPPTQHQPLVEAITGLNAYDWIVFTSANGVTAFFHFFFKAFEDLRDIGGVRIAAVGPATAEKLTALHLKVDLMPKDHLARQIAKELAAYESIENHRILLLRAEVATPELPQLLEDLGAIVDDVACYRTEAETDDPSGATASLSATGADWVTFTSASTVEHFHARFNLPELLRRFPHLKLATIGPETSQALVALGLTPAVEAKTHTLEGLVAALEGAQTRPRKA
jgi:uroporphyrinogen III methyltransferase/synthase